MSAAPRAAPSMRAERSAIAPYDKLDFEVPVLDAGDVNARVWIRIREVEQSLSLIEQILDAPAEGRDHDRDRGQGQGLRRLGLVEASAATCWCGCGSTTRAASRAAICAILMVPVAAAGSRDRGQHRRRLPALQQIVQLLVFRTRSVGYNAQDAARKPHPRPAHRAGARAR